MRLNIAETAGIDIQRVSVKATTTEGMNAEGHGEGVSVQAVALLFNYELRITDQEAGVANSPYSIRVRFAPSPTGFLHVGNVRTALFNKLLAGRHKGTFILRVEDTDAERSELKYETQLMEDLRWLGLDWNEGIGIGGDYGPYRQTDRYDLYQKYAERLFEEDKAYRCFCTEEELEAVRQDQLARRETTVYSGKCRNLTQHEIHSKLNEEIPFTLRLRVRPGTTSFDDLVFGRIEIETDQISDPVLLRGDGSPTYNFCCVIDDILMKITHVIRGDGHLSNTHRQILIYEALGFEPPRFAHLSTILGPDGQKLSKRHGATSIEEFRRQGYLPEALVNYLALLGWSPVTDGQEIMSLDEISAQFDLSRVVKSPAIFDAAKLNWMNRTYIGKTPGADLVKTAKPYFVEAGLFPADSNEDSSEAETWLGEVIDLIKTRVDHLDQLPAETGVIYGLTGDPSDIDDASRESLSTPEGRSVADEFARLVGEKEALTSESYREILGQVKAATKQKGRGLFHPIRAALTGRDSGPDLEKLITVYEQGSRLALPRKVMSCHERLRSILGLL
jgi:glutamyl-tRNA synthetase/nondiscriminating glutamyl-tRNA synthetase